MSQNLVNVEQTSDDQDSETSIELTDDDKKYIEKLMIERSVIQGNKHYEKYRCILPCHICDKIKLSVNPESTNQFFDIIFMEHENDFAFTIEKRRKIIQSLVHEYFETKSTNEEDRKPNRIKATRRSIKQNNVARKSLLSHSFNRYSAKSRSIRATRPTRNLAVKRNSQSKMIKCKQTSDYPRVKKEDRPATGIQKVKLPESKSDKYTVNPPKTPGTKPISLEKRNSYTENLQKNKTPSIVVVKKEVKPTSVVRKVETGDTRVNDENVFLVPSCPVQKTKSKKKKDSNGEEIKKDGTAKEIIKDGNGEEIKKKRKPPMKDPESPFYIPEECMDVALFQERLVYHGFKPADVLNEISSCCGWGRPLFLQGGGIYTGGYACTVRVKGYDFRARSLAQTRSIARHLASSRFLKCIGFKFTFNPEPRIPLRGIVPQIPGPPLRNIVPGSHIPLQNIVPMIPRPPLRNMFPGSHIPPQRIFPGSQIPLGRIVPLMSIVPRCPPFIRPNIRF